MALCLRQLRASRLSAMEQEDETGMDLEIFAEDGGWFRDFHEMFWRDFMAILWLSYGYFTGIWRDSREKQLGLGTSLSSISMACQDFLTPIESWSFPGSFAGQLSIFSSNWSGEINGTSLIQGLVCLLRCMTWWCDLSRHNPVVCGIIDTIFFLCIILVGGLEYFYFPIYWECHHPNWRTIFFRGVQTTNQNI